jgi:hypothetical protein
MRKQKHEQEGDQAAEQLFDHPVFYFNDFIFIVLQGRGSHDALHIIRSVDGFIVIGCGG